MQRLTSCSDFVLPLLTPKKTSRKAGVSKQAAFKPDKVHAQWCATTSSLFKKKFTFFSRDDTAFNSQFLEFIRQCGIEVAGLFLAWLVVEMKNTKQYDKDLYVLAPQCKRAHTPLNGHCRMKLPGEMLLYMQHQAKVLTRLHASAANKVVSRLPFCVGVHMDGHGCHFTFMSTELVKDWRRWFVLPKVRWSDPNSVVAVASAIAVLIVRCYSVCMLGLMRSNLGCGRALLACMGVSHRSSTRLFTAGERHTRCHHDCLS